MGERRTQKLITAATRLMEPAERVEVTTLAKLGSAPIAANLTVSIAASAAVTAAASLLGGGVGFVAFVRREAYIVLTDQRVMFFEAIRSTGGPGKHLASFPRHLVACSAPKSSGLGLFMKLSMDIKGMSQPLKLTFAPLPPAYRARGRELADALPRSPG